MNRKAQTFFIPLFTITVLVVLGYGLIRMGVHTTFADIPTVGERAETVFDGAHRLAATEQYLEFSAVRAAHLEAMAASDSSAEDRFVDRFNRLMAAHPIERIPTTFSMHTESGGPVLRAGTDFVIPLSETRVQQTTESIRYAVGDAFDVFPVQGDDWFISEWFGKRDFAGGSKNHPGIDIAKPEHGAVLAVADGTIERRSWYARQGGDELYYLSHAMPSGWVCEYFHIQPLPRYMDGKHHVERGEQIATVRDERLYGLHLDFRCYHPGLLASPQQAEQVFGADSVANSKTHPSRATLAAHDDNARVYLDPYCLFNEAIQQQILDSSLQHEERIADEYRPGDSIEQSIRYTCQTYHATGVLTPEEPTSGSEAFVDIIVENTLEHEGVFSNHASDRGGPTQYGITLDTLRTYRNDPSLDIDDVQALTRDEAIRIYKDRYFYGPGVDRYPAPVLPLLFDMAVNHGPSNAFFILQESLKELGYDLETTERADEQSVEATHIALEERGPTAVIDAIVDRRLLFYERIIESNPSQEVFLDGWRNRAESFRDLQLLEDLDVTIRERYETSSPQSRIFKQLEQPVPDLEDIREMTRSVRLLQEGLGTCSAGDTMCAAERIARAPAALQDVQACEDYVERVVRTIEACRDRSCACALQHPSGVENLTEMHLRADEIAFVFDHGEVVRRVISPDWPGVGENLPEGLQIRMYGGQQASQEWVWYASEPASLVSADGAYHVPTGTDWLWFSVSDQPGGVQVRLADDSSPVCDGTLPVRYCGEHGSFWASQQQPARGSDELYDPFDPILP